MLLNVLRRFTVRTVLTSVLLSCTLCLQFSSVLLAADAGISGKVLDSEGAAIEKAQVFIRVDASSKRESAKRPTVMIETNKEGRFSATATSGFHDVCVMADAFSPHCEKVLVEQKPVALR